MRLASGQQAAQVVVAAEALRADVKVAEAERPLEKSPEPLHGLCAAGVAAGLDAGAFCADG